MAFANPFARKPTPTPPPPSATSSQSAPNFNIQSTSPFASIAGAGTKAVAPIGPQGLGPQA